MQTLIRGLVGLLPMLVLAGSAQASLVFRTTLHFGSDNVETVVTVSQVGDNLNFSLVVDATNTGNIADLRGIFFDVADESLLSVLVATGADVTDELYSANSVTDLGNGANVNGSMNHSFDAGVEIGTQGMGQNDIQSTSFVLSRSDTVALNLATFFRTSTGANDTVLAVRSTSVGPAGGNRGGSAKDASPGPVDGQVVPEPSSVVIWGLVASGLGWNLRRRRTTFVRG